MSDLKKVEVSAAVIVKDGNIFATQRGLGEFQGKWEFPCSEVSDDENMEDALIREVKQDLNADINVIDYLTTVRYDYPNYHLVMHTYICTLKNGNEIICEDDKSDNKMWLQKESLEDVDWVPADVVAVKEYKKLRRIA